MTDCELYNHPNITGGGCPCGRVVVMKPPALPPPVEVAAAVAQLELVRGPKVLIQRRHFDRTRTRRVYA